jgi:DNA replication and repair protein RecF
VGPHRDEVIFEIDGRDARSFASQGQQRTIALAWKLAEVGVITEIAGQPPVLLLDDVMSELDESRRHALTRFVGEAAQTFVTTTNLGYFDDELVRRAKVVNLA